MCASVLTLMQLCYCTLLLHSVLSSATKCQCEYLSSDNLCLLEVLWFDAIHIHTCDVTCYSLFKYCMTKSLSFLCTKLCTLPLKNEK